MAVSFARSPPSPTRPWRIVFPSRRLVSPERLARPSEMVCCDFFIAPQARRLLRRVAQPFCCRDAHEHRLGFDEAVEFGNGAFLPGKLRLALGGRGLDLVEIGAE